MQRNTPIDVKPINKDKIKMFLQVTLYLFVITVFEFAIAFTVPHEYKWVRIFIFIALTIVKAYYIMSEFMHLGHEKGSLKMSVLLPLLFVVFLLFILLFQADAIYQAVY
jgi:cytochrome c oxidase subunit IV|tara:strand:- start:217 stop:543 length:327 start_codon:yes stop_codon:yes gene_type:complete